MAGGATPTPTGGTSAEAMGGVPAEGTGGAGSGYPNNGGASVAGQYAAGTDRGGLGGITAPVPTAMAEPKDGTRLKARYLVGDDGSRQWNFGWYDSQRAENCSFSVASDGVTRCLPTTSGVVVSAPGTGYFSDADCSQQLAAVGTTCNNQSAPKSAYRVSVACATSLEVFDVGAKYEDANVYSKAGAACTSIATPATVAFYAVGAQVPAPSFVAATEQNDSLCG